MGEPDSLDLGESRRRHDRYRPFILTLLKIERLDVPRDLQDPVPLPGVVLVSLLMPRITVLRDFRPAACLCATRPAVRLAWDSLL